MSSSHPPGDAEVSTTRYARLLEVQTLMARVSREIGPALDLERVLKTVLEAVRDLVERGRTRGIHFNAGVRFAIGEDRESAAA